MNKYSYDYRQASELSDSELTEKCEYLKSLGDSGKLCRKDIDDIEFEICLREKQQKQ